MIIILGTGYIGTAFVNACRERHITFRAVSRKVADYTDFMTLVQLLETHSARAVINCAAHIGKPSIEANEKERKKTLLANTVFPQTLVNACELTKTALLHVSTGCLYQGAKVEFGHEDLVKPNLMDEDVLPAWEAFPDKFRGWSEEDPPALEYDKTCGWYTGSKQLAEEVVRKFEDAWIARIRLPFDQFDHPRNLLTKLLTYERLVDQVNSLSHRGDFVNACLDMIEKRVPFGTYNVTNLGAVRTTKICALIEKFLTGFSKQWRYWNPVDFRDAHPMPVSNCILDGSKLAGANIKMRPVIEAIEWSLQNWVTAR